MWNLYFNGLHGFCSQDVTAVSSNAASVSNVINLSLSLSGATPTVMRHPSKFHIRDKLYTSPLIFPRFLLPSASLNRVALAFLSNNFTFKVATDLIQESRFFSILQCYIFLIGFFSKARQINCLTLFNSIL